jgi:hypothetical protein
MNKNNTSLLNPSPRVAYAALALMAAFFVAGVIMLPSIRTAHAADTGVSQDPPLTPEQQAYMNTYVTCQEDYKSRHLPRSQQHVFERSCMNDHGYFKPVALPPPVQEQPVQQQPVQQPTEPGASQPSLLQQPAVLLPAQ